MKNQNHARHLFGLILALAGLISVATLLLGPARLASAQVVAPSWSYTGSLNTARYAYTATLLTNGRVLVAGGGVYSSGVLNSAELYDPATGMWSSTGNLNAGRRDHTATLLPNGKVLVAGGSSFNYPNSLNSAELYDPATGTWSSTGNLNTARVFHTATLLPNGKVLVAGGAGNCDPNFCYALTSAELYDPATGMWSSTGNLPAFRSGHTATLLQNGKVLVIQFGSSELYDPATETWSSAGNLNIGFGNYTATLLQNGKVLVAEYTSAELYDPTTGAWSSTGNLNTARAAHTATLLPNGKVLVAGGYNCDSDDCFSLNSAELYDPATGMWSITATLNYGRHYHTASLLLNGKVLVAGGFNSTVYAALNSAELYDPGTTPTPTPTPSSTPTPTPTATPTATPTPTPTPTPSPSWSITGNLNTARNFGHTATRLPGGKVLVAGGAGNKGSLNSAELYDALTGIWSNTGNLNTARDSHTATLLPNGKVLVAGGFSCAPPPATCQALNSSELYDPTTGTWSITGNLNTARDSHTATLLPNGKVLIAGGVNTNTVFNSAELYDPVSGTWSITGNLNTGRLRHTATLLQNGKVWVAGGDDGNGALNGTELYDSATGTWNITGINLNTARELHTATMLPDGKVVFAGGQSSNNAYLNSAELYDPATGTLSYTGNLNTGRAYHTANLLAGPDGQVLIAGGFNLVNGFPNIINSAELYNPATGTWSNTATLNTGRRFHTATLLLSGKVLVAGPGNSAELYYPGPNQIDDAQVFVRQQYLDFLNREPDPGGLAYWTERITGNSRNDPPPCPAGDARCVNERRIDVSAAFFISLEFQQTGNFVYGLYKGALGRQPTYPEFTVDHNRVIGGPDLEAEKAALANDFVQRPEFLQHYPGSMTNTQFVNTLFDRAGLFPFTAERQAEIDAMNNQGRTRAQVLRNVVDIQAFRDREFNPSFVLMQYYGYLGRSVDQGGYEYWLDVLNRTNNYRGMVCAFITSSEYQFRFGPSASRSNADCSQ